MSRDVDYVGQWVVVQLGFITQQYRRISNCVVRAEGLTEDHMYCLRECSLGNSASKDLRNDLNVPRYQMTRIMQDLEEGGYVKVRPSPDDGRIRLLKCLPRGRDLIRRVDVSVARSLIIRMPGLFGKTWRYDKICEHLVKVIEAMEAPSFWDQDAEFDHIYHEAIRAEEEHEGLATTGKQS
jgi:DNA-binding MarR family transcriptional regulator